MHMKRGDNVGYDCRIVMVDREEIGKWKQRCPDLSFSTLYSEVLWTQAVCMWSSSDRYLSREFDFLDTLECDGACEFSEEGWEAFLLKLKDKIKSTSFYDVAVKEDCSLEQMEDLTRAYLVLSSYSIDFKVHSIVFEHDW